MNHRWRRIAILLVTLTTLGCQSSNAEEIEKTRAMMERAVERGDFVGARLRLRQIEKLEGRVKAPLRTRIVDGARRQDEERQRARQAEQEGWLEQLEGELDRGEDADVETARGLVKSLAGRGVTLDDKTQAGFDALLERARARDEERTRKRLSLADLPALAGRTPEQVEKILGEPSSCGRLEVKEDVLLSFDHCLYDLSSARSIQIDYILNKAAFFEVFGVKADPSIRFLGRLGFESKPPDNETRISQSWFGHQGWNSIILIRHEPSRDLQITADHIDRSRISKDRRFRKRVIRGSKDPG